MQVSRQNGWVVDTSAKTLAWPGVSSEVALPEASLAALVYFGLGYLESQAAARSVNDTFRHVWLDATRRDNPDAKLADAPKGVVPPSDSAEYRTELRKAHEALFAKLAAGYEVGMREGGGDPIEEETDKIARMWLQGIASQFTHAGKPWYVLPPKRKVARDDDAYNGPKYATFGEALAAFKVSAAPAGGRLAGRTADGKAWPFRMKAGLTVAEAIATEAARRVAERGEGKPAVTLSGEGEGAEF